MAHSLLTGTTTVSIESIISCKKKSSFDRLILVTVYVTRFVNALKKAVMNRHSTDVNTSLHPQEDFRSDHISVTFHTHELLEVETMWMKLNYSPLKTGIFQLGRSILVSTATIMVCGDNLPLSAKHPIILPRDHHLTTLIVRRAHEKVCHNGTKETLTEVRSRFWIVKGRSLVKKLIHQCQICRRL